MAKVMFVDDRLAEIIRQWDRSGCASNYELVPLEPFISIERTREIVQVFQPDVLLVGYGLSNSTTTGADVIRVLRQEGYTGRIIANSGGGAEQFRQAGIELAETANRNPQRLAEMLHNH